VVFEENIHPNGSRLHSARIIPFRGSWVEFSIDINDVCYVHIDKKKKFPATALLRAFGYGTDEELYGLFYDTRSVKLVKAHFQPGLRAHRGRSWPRRSWTRSRARSSSSTDRAHRWTP
jgi:DNA-directed RNA polymerase beta subunit